MTTPISPPAPAPTVPEIETAARALKGLTRVTPVSPWEDPELTRRIGPNTRVLLKLELFQHTGTFKVRGALTVMGSLEPEALARGVTAVSAGNHAAAVAFAAARLATSARVVMPRTASPARVALCRAWGAD